MPMGTGGKALLLLSGGIDSPVAGFSLMKRGVDAGRHPLLQLPLHQRARQGKGDRPGPHPVRILQGGMRVHVVPFTKIQMQIHEKCPEALRHR